MRLWSPPDARNFSARMSVTAHDVTGVDTELSVAQSLRTTRRMPPVSPRDP
jgi:hypothetical protein